MSGSPPHSYSNDAASPFKNLLSMWAWLFQHRYQYLTLFVTCTCSSYLMVLWYLKESRRRLMHSLVSDPSDRASLWRAYNLIVDNELTWEFQTAMETRGLLTTYAIPSISRVLKQTGSFETDVQRRYADMSLIISEFLENNANGATDGSVGQPHRAHLAIQRLNAIHHRYGHLILHRDMLYVLAVFMVTPVEFCETRWSRRRLTPGEKHCMYLHWMEIGRLMNVEVDKAWFNYEDCLNFKRNYEQRYMTFQKENYDIAMSTIDYFINTCPQLLQPAIRYLALQSLSIMQETPAHAAALGLPPPNPVLGWFVDKVLTLRAWVYAYLIPPPRLSHNYRISGEKAIEIVSSSACPFNRYHPARPLEFGNKTYTVPSEGGRSYAIEELGPKFIKVGELCTKPKYKFDDQDSTLVRRSHSL